MTNTDMQIDVETYQKVVDDTLIAKDKEIFGLRVQIAQLQANLDKIKSQNDNVTNPESKGI